MYMQFSQPYRSRSISFAGITCCGNWKLKCYTISLPACEVHESTIAAVQACLPEWLEKPAQSGLTHYYTGFLIIHEGADGCYAVLCCWCEENMLQLFAWRALKENPQAFELISDKGLVSCVWEMQVLCFERNAWVEDVMLQQGQAQAITSYLHTCFHYSA
jgi:hypothetical protein